MPAMHLLHSATSVLAAFVLAASATGSNGATVGSDVGAPSCDGGECPAALEEASRGGALLQVQAQRAGKPPAKPKPEGEEKGDKPSPKPEGEEHGDKPPPADAPTEDMVDSSDEEALSPHEQAEEGGDMEEVDCGGGLKFMTPKSQAAEKRETICKAASGVAAGLGQVSADLTGRANATTQDHCPVHRQNSFCSPRYDVPDLLTHDFCRIFTQEPVFWGNSCSNYYYWRPTKTVDGIEYGPCRCCRFNSDGRFRYYNSGVGNNVDKCSR